MITASIISNMAESPHSGFLRFLMISFFVNFFVEEEEEVKSVSLFWLLSFLEMAMSENNIGGNQ